MTTNENREIEAREKEVLVTEDSRAGLVFRPDVDILEVADAFVIHADMPGASEETVELSTSVLRIASSLPSIFKLSNRL